MSLVDVRKECKWEEEITGGIKVKEDIDCGSIWVTGAGDIGKRKFSGQRMFVINHSCYQSYTDIIRQT